MITTLPAVGRFIVDTETDVYDVDATSRIAVWHDLDAEAAGLHVEPEPFLFDTVECVVGAAMLFDADDRPRATPRVVGITPVTVEVSA